MDLIARRDHSERELVQKLTRAQHSADEIAATIEELRERGWLPDPSVLAEREADRLRRRGKSEMQIHAWLIKKGLPAAQRQADAEVETGLRSLSSAWPKLLRQAQRDLDRAATATARSHGVRRGVDAGDSEDDRLNLQAALKQRCLKWMAGRGFSGATARAVFTRLLEENPLK
jgi:SOS response regulatory protein OraA/RecX